MGLYFLFLSLSLFTLSQSQPSTTGFSQTDFEAAIADMRSESYYGFAILLRMFNVTTQPNWDLTFLMPGDKELSESDLSTSRIEDFLLSHSIPMPLFFNDLVHFPSGSIIPSGKRDRLIRIHNHGRLNYFVNNARIVAPNVCSNSIIKCHGIDAVIDYDNHSSGHRVDKRPPTPPNKSPPPKPNSFMDEHH